VWSDNVCQHRFSRLGRSFEADFTGEKTTPRIEIKDKSSHLFRFIINTCRTYWKEELEGEWTGGEKAKEEYVEKYKWNLEGVRLAATEKEEQMQNLTNKLFVIGYMLHSYKSAVNTWAVWMMENRISGEYESGGGSGKSLLVKFIENVKKVEKLNGRDKKLTENKHIGDRVTEETDLMVIEDANKHFDFNFFYNMITNDMNVNPKNMKSKVIKFEKSPKIIINSNFPPRDTDGSTSRRIIYMNFSDYYHEKNEGLEYEKSVKVSDDFGYVLWDSKYKEEYWNQDLNFLVDCLEFYLKCIKEGIDKIQPPMENLTERIRRQSIGERFLDWAEEYFAKTSSNLDKLLLKKEVFRAYKDATGENCSAKTFKDKISTFCKMKAYIETFNPAKAKGYDKDGKRIIRTAGGKTQEYIYIKSVGRELNEHIEEF